MGCCKYFCYTLLGLLALLLAPLASYKPKLVKLDDVKEWGLKGPGATSLPYNMAGVYYLDGNQAPWGTGVCNETETKRDDLCRNGYKRSNLFIFDSTHMYFDRESGTMGTYASGFGFSELKKHKGGFAISYIVALLRAGYIFNKKDAEFVALRGKEMGDYFEGAMKLKIGYFALGKLIGVDYRVTAEDVKGDGSVISRFTWKESKSDVPAKKSDAFKEYEYKMVRILDKNGKVNQGAIEDAKKIYGSNVIFLGDPTF